MSNDVSCVDSLVTLILAKQLDHRESQSRRTYYVHFTVVTDLDIGKIVLS